MNGKLLATNLIKVAFQFHVLAKLIKKHFGTFNEN